MNGQFCRDATKTPHCFIKIMHPIRGATFTKKLILEKIEFQSTHPMRGATSRLSNLIPLSPGKGLLCLWLPNHISVGIPLGKALQTLPGLLFKCRQKEHTGLYTGMSCPLSIATCLPFFPSIIQTYLLCHPAPYLMPVSIISLFRS